MEIRGALRFGRFWIEVGEALLVSEREWRNRAALQLAEGRARGRGREKRTLNANMVSRLLLEVVALGQESADGRLAGPVEQQLAVLPGLDHGTDSAKLHEARFIIRISSQKLMFEHQK